MRIRFNKGQCPFWNRIVRACPDNLTIEEFVESCSGTLFTDKDYPFAYAGVEFASDADYTWFLLNIDN